VLLWQNPPPDYIEVMAKLLGADNCEKMDDADQGLEVSTESIPHYF
jgi:hypothetical protein